MGGQLMIVNQPVRWRSGMNGKPDDDSSVIDLAADRFERPGTQGKLRESRTI